MTWLNPEVVISSNPKRLISIESRIKEVTRIVSPDNLSLIQAIDNQWRKLPQEVTFKEWVSSSESEAITVTIDSFCYKVREKKTLEGQKDCQDYKEIGQFALEVLALLHSQSLVNESFLR